MRGDGVNVKNLCCLDLSSIDYLSSCIGCVIEIWVQACSDTTFCSNQTLHKWEKLGHTHQCLAELVSSMVIVWWRIINLKSSCGLHFVLMGGFQKYALHVFHEIPSTQWASLYCGGGYSHVSWVSDEWWCGVIVYNPCNFLAYFLFFKIENICNFYIK